MSLWLWLLAACGIAFVTKFVGFLLPEETLESPWVSTLTAGVTVGLLASLVAVNTFVSGQQLAIDARLVALVAAGLALLLKAPYLIVVVVGAVAAAIARLAGLS